MAGKCADARLLQYTQRAAHFRYFRTERLLLRSNFSADDPALRTKVAGVPRVRTRVRTQTSQPVVARRVRASC